MKLFSISLLLASFLIYFLVISVAADNSKGDKEQAKKPSKVKEPRKVFDCFLYDGEDYLLNLKLSSMSPFVDYFVITESEFSASGVKRVFRFNMFNFRQFSHKIIYLPLRNIPYRWQGLSQKKIEENKEAMEYSFNMALKVLSRWEDVIILSEIDQIISKNAIEEFRSGSSRYACTEMLLYYEYFNRKSVHSSKQGKQLPNYWYEGARFLTLQQLNDGFKNNSYKAHRSNVCKTETILNAPENKRQKVLRSAGWHFAQADKSHILQKLDSIYNQTSLTDVSMENGHLPQELVKDVTSNQALSKYAKHIAGINVQKLKTTQVIKENKDMGVEAKELLFQRNASRLVVECFPYNGEEHILNLKLQITKSYIDYVIITQGLYSHSGLKKELTFNFSRFEKYAHKIIYLPLRNFPITQQGMPMEQKWKNEHYQKYAAIHVLELLCLPQDIVIASDTDQILSRQGFMRFDPMKHDWVNTQMRLFYWYFNRMSTYHVDDRLNVPNYWYTGPKITTLKVLKQKLSGDVVSLRRRVGCITNDVSSKWAQWTKEGCRGYIIRRAGWHFSYILDEKNLIRKMRYYTHSPDSNFTIDHYQSFRNSAVAPGAKNKDIDALTSYLPIQLIIDIMQKKEKSQYAPYYIKTDFNEIPKKHSYKFNFNNSSKRVNKLIDINRLQDQQTDKASQVNTSIVEVANSSPDEKKEVQNQTKQEPKSVIEKGSLMIIEKLSEMGYRLIFFVIGILVPISLPRLYNIIKKWLQKQSQNNKHSSKVPIDEDEEKRSLQCLNSM